MIAAKTLTVVDEITVDKKLLSEALGKWMKSLSLPIVQREFVWESDDVRELIDSIVHDYPIGTVILWETEEDFPGSPLFDSDASGATTRTNTYIIDGQQRLTALLLVKEGWKIKREGNDISLAEPISYNPSNNKLYVSDKVGIDISLLVNAAMGDIEANQELMQTRPKDFKKAVTDIGTKIAGYPLPIYTLKTHHKISSEEREDMANEIAEIFIRVNRSGERLENLQLFLSFFAAAFTDLKKDLVDSYRNLNKKYNQQFPRWEVMNRFVFSNLGMTQNQVTRVNSFKEAIRKTKEEYSGKKSTKLHGILEKSYSSADAVLGVITHELGIYTANRMPSQNVLIPLFKWAYENKIEKEADISSQTRKKMLGWFVVASFNGLYGTKINKRIQTDLDTIVDNGSAFPLSKMLSNMKNEDVPANIRRGDLYDYYVDIFRNSAYSMLLNVILFRNKASNWAGQTVTSKDENAIHHIFPREYLRDNGITESNSVNDFANMTIISSRINSEIGDKAPSDYLPGYQKEFKDHMIPSDTRLWSTDKYDEFLDERRKLIWNETKKVLSSLSSEFDRSS